MCGAGDAALRVVTPPGNIVMEVVGFDHFNVTFGVDRMVTETMLGTWGGHTGSEEMILGGGGTHFDEIAI